MSVPRNKMAACASNVEGGATDLVTQAIMRVAPMNAPPPNDRGGSESAANWRAMSNRPEFARTVTLIRREIRAMTG